MKRVWSEDHAFELWLRIEIAASEAWARLGVVPAEDARRIGRATFDRAKYDMYFEETKHDIFSFTRAVVDSLGEEGRWVHHGLTSNDVKDTALSLQMREAIGLIIAGVGSLREAVAARAIEFKDTPCMGRSHGMHAEPLSFGLKLALWWTELGRQAERLEATAKRVSVGKISGPVGTYASVPPEIETHVCNALGLEPAPVSNQIIQRDRHAEFVQSLALLAATLEKIATEIRALQRTEIGEVQEPFGEPGFVTKGSSSMPHKRNPELSERVCGLARLVRGHGVTALENVTLWHERDISHSSAERVILPDSALAVDYMLHLLTGVVAGMTVYPGRMMRNLELSRGAVFSPRLMLALVEAGMERSAAYELAQEHAATAFRDDSDFREVVCGDSRVTDLVAEPELRSLFDYGYFLRFTDRIFRRIGLPPSGDVCGDGKFGQ